MRVAVLRIGVEADFLQCLPHAPAPRVVVEFGLLNEQAFFDDLSDRQTR